MLLRPATVYQPNGVSEVMLHRAVSVFSDGYELQPLIDAGGPLFGDMADINQPRAGFAGNQVENSENKLPMVIVQTHTRFVQNQDGRAFHHRAGEEHQTLLTE